LPSIIYIDYILFCANITCRTDVWYYYVYKHYKHVVNLYIEHFPVPCFAVVIAHRHLRIRVTRNQKCRQLLGNLKFRYSKGMKEIMSLPVEINVILSVVFVVGKCYHAWRVCYAQCFLTFDLNFFWKMYTIMSTYQYDNISIYIYNISIYECVKFEFYGKRYIIRKKVLRCVSAEHNFSVSLISNK